MISDSMNVDTNILLITDNVAELYYEKVLVVYLLEKMLFDPYLTLFY